MPVVLAHRSPLVADVLARALVVLGVEARHGTPDEAEPGELLVCDAELGEPADVVLVGAGGPGPRRRRAARGRWRRSGSAARRHLLWRRQEPASPLEGLTPREREVLALLADGASNREVAARLAMSPRTPPARTCRTCSPSCRSRAGWPPGRSPGGTATSRAGPEAWCGCSSQTKTGSSGAPLPSCSGRRATTWSTRRPRRPRSDRRPAEGRPGALEQRLAETGCLLPGREGTGPG